MTVVKDFDNIFFLMTYIRSKNRHLTKQTSEHALLTISNTWLTKKDIDICNSPWQNLHHVSSVPFWYSVVLHTSQVLEVVRNCKTSIVVLILLILRLNKSPFNSHFPILAPNVDIFLFYFYQFRTKMFISLQWKLVTFKCTDGTNLWPRIFCFFKLDCSHVLLFIL